METVMEPVGTKEILTKLGIGRSTFDAWRTQGNVFPEPKWTVGDRPAWDWTDILTWVKSTPYMIDGKVRKPGRPK